MFMMMTKINKQAWERRNLYINFIGKFGRKKNGLGSLLNSLQTTAILGTSHVIRKVLQPFKLEGNIKMDIEGILFSVLTVFMLQRL